MQGHNGDETSSRQAWQILMGQSLTRVKLGTIIHWLCCPYCDAVGPVTCVWNCRELNLFNLHLQLILCHHEKQTRFGITVCLFLLGKLRHGLLHSVSRRKWIIKTRPLPWQHWQWVGLGNNLPLHEVHKMVFSEALCLLASCKLFLNASLTFYTFLYTLYSYIYICI